MIPRYTRPDMAHIWSDENRLQQMLEVEILSVEAWAQIGQAPKTAAAQIRKRAKINVARIQEIEQTVKHDVIAFLTQVNETVGPSARYLHKGMTSSDVLDTALGMQLKQSCDLLIAGVERLLPTIKTLAVAHKDTPQMGRTHGVHAEPMTFGLKALSWYTEMQRALALLPGDLRETLLLVVVGELTHQEVADLQGIPLGTVLSRVSRARRRLREYLLAAGTRK
jgi:adenylosuccinate lyase